MVLSPFGFGQSRRDEPADPQPGFDHGLGPADDLVTLRQGSLRPKSRLGGFDLVRAATTGAIVCTILAGGCLVVGTRTTSPDRVAALPTAPTPGQPGNTAQAAPALRVVLASATVPATLQQVASSDPEMTGSLAGGDLGRGARTGGAAAGDPGGSRSVTARLDPNAPALAPSRLGPQAGFAQPLTKLVAFDSAPFPYSGNVPGGGSFLNSGPDERRGHRSWRGRVLYENETFNDRRVLMHAPSGFDPDRPGVIVVFFHGHGATLKRDVLDRQQVAAQVSASGANALLLAPQFAVDAADSSVGKFWQPGAFKRFLDEGARQFASLSGDPAVAAKIAAMPVVVVGYSGGFAPAAWAIQAGGAKNRVRGVVMLDAAYGEFEKFADWIATSRNGFFLNASTHFTQGGASTLRSMMVSRDIAIHHEIPASLSTGGATFLSVEASHRDYVNTAWTHGPIRDVLARLPEYRLRDGEALVADARGRTRSRSASATATQ